MAIVALFDDMRSLGFASISGTYAAVGAAFGHKARMLIINNNTNGDMIFSYDNTVAAGQIFVAQSSHLVLDLTSNRDGLDPILALAVGTQIYAKQSSAPSSGSVYISVIYGKGE